MVVLLFGALSLLNFDRSGQRYFYSGAIFIRFWPMGTSLLLFGCNYYSGPESSNEDVEYLTC